MTANQPGPGGSDELPPDPVPDMKVAWITVLSMFHGLTEAGATTQEAAAITAAFMATQGKQDGTEA